ncbi:acetyl esterase/lipase [Salinibacterium sp. CAN_S4]
MAVTVEYRLAPEHTYPAALEDCHAALRWMRSNYERLSIDIDRIVLFGVSAGGGLAASLALKVRDGREPQLLGQLLSCPMLDNATREPKEGASPRVDTITWTYEDNRMAWAAYLGRTSAAIAVPAQAGSLVGLPRTFIDVGTWDIFLSEDVAYTRRLTEAGVDTELHVWSRGYHGFDLREPELSASKLAIAARHRWLRDLVLGDRS